MQRKSALSRVTTVGYAGPFTLAYGYDAVGQRTTLTDPNSNATVYAYNNDGQIMSFTDTSARVTTYTFDPGGRVTTIVQPSGMVRSIIYDEVSQIISLKDRTSGGTEYQRLTITYDKVGNPVNILDGSGALSTYSYDNANKITNANISAPAFNVTYTYDAVGNKTFTGENSATTYTYDLAGQAVTSVNGGFTTTYTYDTNGNLTKIVLPWSTTTLTYDKENRMTVYNQDGTLATYTYDGDGMKRTETVSGVTTTLLWDGSNYFGEVASGSYSKRYYTVDSRMVSYEMVSGSARKDYLTDQLGSVTAEMDQTQSRTFDGRYFPYGQPLWFSGTPGSFDWVGTLGYRATGQFRASHYVRTRHYSNQTQIWTTRDLLWPLELPYVYCTSNPCLYVDYYGMKYTGTNPACIALDAAIDAIVQKLNNEISPSKYNPWTDRDGGFAIFINGRPLLDKFGNQKYTVPYGHWKKIGILRRQYLNKLMEWFKNNCSDGGNTPPTSSSCWEPVIRIDPNSRYPKYGDPRTNPWYGPLIRPFVPIIPWIFTNIGEPLIRHGLS